MFASYESRRRNYIGSLLTNTYFFNAELVEHVTCDMHPGKAAGLDGHFAEQQQCIVIRYCRAW